MEQLVYVVSDSVGETAEFVVRAAASQFDHKLIDIQKFPYIEDEDTINEVIRAAKENKAIIAYTLVIPHLNQFLRERAKEENVHIVDILSPMIDLLKETTMQKPKNQPGLVRKLDEDYFKKIEAIEFAVKYDDGRDPRGLLRADIVLLGVSRTSKTPLSMYLANKRIKVANVPIVPEVEPPEELFMIPQKRCIGLIIHPDQLYEIRKERLKSLGLPGDASYASMERILEELQFAEKIMKKIGCPIIDVSKKAVEETANIILDMIKKR